MRVRVWVDDDPGNELRTLRGWLHDEPTVRQFGELSTELSAVDDTWRVVFAWNFFGKVFVYW